MNKKLKCGFKRALLLHICHLFVTCHCAYPKVPILKAVFNIENSSIPSTTSVVLMHGMGDAAQNPGMISIRNAISSRLGGVYTTNIQIGNNRIEDTKNGYFLNLDKQVEKFCQQVRKDAKLSQGFNAIGFSQGNLIIRGYIERYNDPPVKSFISVHGPMAGVGELPTCSPSATMCRRITEIVAKAAYSKTIQENIAQSNYYRVPTRMQEYLQNALFLPDINNERNQTKSLYRENFIRLEKLVLVKALRDTMVVPKESEWFGAFQSNSYTKILFMNETTWFKEDSFGLKTLFDEKKVFLEETKGDHLQFGVQDLYQWVDRYFGDNGQLLAID